MASPEHVLSDTVSAIETNGDNRRRDSLQEEFRRTPEGPERERLVREFERLTKKTAGRLPDWRRSARRAVATHHREGEAPK